MIGFWLFCLVMDLLCPALMILVGCLFRKKPPRKINSWYGYRTTRSMRNQQTWAFAHKTCGTIWFWAGIVLAALSLPPAAAVFGRDINTIGISCCVIVGVQVVVMLLSIIPVERALKRNFDEYGRKIG